jgi:hypothetical protein
MVYLAGLIGRNVFIRTVTNYYTGRLISAGGDYLHLEGAAWIADTGRFATALATGQLSEVEPYPADCWVAAGAIVDVCEWPHDLPRTQI